MSFVRCSAAVVFAATVVVAGTARAQATKPPASAVATPAGAGGTRVGFINSAALLKGMPGYAQAESLFTKDAEVANGEAQKLRAAFDSAVATYQQSQTMMTPTSRTAKEKELQARQDSLQTKLQQLQTRVQTKERELLAPLQERLRAIIDGIRAEGNYVMIVDLGSDASANIISYDKSADITLRVAQRLSQQN